METTEPRWMSMRESYAENLWWDLKATLMPDKWVIEQFDKKMNEYDEKQRILQQPEGVQRHELSDEREENGGCIIRPNDDTGRAD